MAEMERSRDLSFQDALEGWRFIRKCEARGLAECAGWLREFLSCARDAEVSASAALAALEEEDELKELPRHSLPLALKVTSLLKRNDYFGAFACMRACPSPLQDPEEQHPLLLFAEIFSHLSLEQTRAANWVAAGHRKEGDVVALKPGRLQATARKVSKVLEAAAARGRLDAFGWWLLAGVRRAQQQQPECISALLEAIRLCRCFVSAWDELTQQLAALLYATEETQVPTAAAAAAAAAANAAAAGATGDDVGEGGKIEQQQQQQQQQEQQEQQLLLQADAMETEERRPPDQNTFLQDSSACEKTAAGVTGRMLLLKRQQQQQQQHGGPAAVDFSQGGRSWGSCSVSAAAAAAAAATAEETARWSNSAAAAAAAAAVDGGSSAAAAAVDALAKKSEAIPWATPSFVFEKLSGASLSAFLAGLKLPDAGVYGHFFFARFCMQINRFDEAVNSLVQILHVFPNCPLVVAQLAKCCCELGENERALELFYLLEKINPSRLDFVSDFARLLGSKNDILALQQLSERCNQTDPCAMGSLLVAALLARLRGAPEKSIDLLHAATALNPTASEGWCLLGYAYLESGDLLSAARAFAAASAAAPAAASAYLGAGQTQALLHNWPAAERLYTNAVRCRPDLPIVWWHLGKAQKEQKKIAHALKSFNQCWFLGETTEAAAECFCCARLLRATGEAGPVTAVVWAERLFEQFVSKELALDGAASARILLRQFCTDWKPRDSRLTSALKKASEAVLQAVALLADYYRENGDREAAQFYSELLQDFGGVDRVKQFL